MESRKYVLNDKDNIYQILQGSVMAQNAQYQKIS